MILYWFTPVKNNERYEFAGNSIRTSKYSVFSFLPRNLLRQFHRVAYIYFLIIAVLNQLPQLAVFGRGASIMPLAFVLSVTAVKDAYEDWRRHGSDRVENNRLACVLVDDQFRPKKWKDIQTVNLDGESNLKTRYAKQETLSKIPEKEMTNGLIKRERPNRNIYGFQANTEIEGKRLSLGPSNILLRGCELKNTAWAIGVAMYCGRETKAMLNSSGATSKRSRL
uniref:P-type ATPase N-terminal domain-containing protein n=2 Tax=Populus alba TaxID=43335 RepID=A0A4U5R0T5_POPAL|nr:hypothetical protein D5086_0000019790 [Populus alba]